MCHVYSLVAHGEEEEEEEGRALNLFTLTLSPSLPSPSGILRPSMLSPHLIIQLYAEKHEYPGLYPSPMSLPLDDCEPFLTSFSAGPVIQFLNLASENSPGTGTMPPRRASNTIISLNSTFLTIPTHISRATRIYQARIRVAGSPRQLH